MAGASHKLPNRRRPPSSKPAGRTRAQAQREVLGLHLLGSPRVLLGAEIELPTRKSLALLAYIAVNGAVPRSDLAALLWGEQRDDDARRNLRQELHRLHATPVGTWLEAQSDWLALRGDAWIDVRELRAALERGDVQRVAALARGPLLQGFELRGAPAFMDWLAAERESIANARRDAIRAWARDREAEGDARTALSALRELLAEADLDEPTSREAMRLLQLTGERSEALAVYDRLRTRLANELSAEPQQETVALARRIAATAEPPRAPRGVATPDLRAPLIGREMAWSALAGAADRLALLEGEAGIGKTRTAVEFARAHGACLVLKGREISRDTPFYPVADALWQAYQDDTTWYERLDPAWRREVGRLLPMMADDGEAKATDSLPFSEAKGRFIEGLTQALLTAAGGGTLLADDLQWFDTASAELIAHLACRDHRVRLLATARPLELEDNAAARAALDAVAREGRLQRIALQRLSIAEVLLLVRALSGSRGAKVFARRLHDATAGNPLFILESLRELFSAGVLWREGDTWATRYDDETEDYRELPLSATVREAVLRRIDRLGAATRRLLDAASLAGDGFDPELLADTALLSENEVVDAVERAVSAGVVVDTAPGYRFSHDVIRRALDDALLPERRRLLHRKLAEALEAAGSDAAGIAAHLERGGRAAAAVQWRIRAAEDAARVYSLREALAQYERALADGVEPKTAWRVHLARVEHLRNLADRAGWAKELEAMARLEPVLQDPVVSVELAVRRAVHGFDMGCYADALAVVEDARLRLRGAIDDIAEAHLLLEMGAALKALGRIDEAQQHLLIAVERFRDVSPLKYANAAFWLSMCALERGDLTAADIWSRIAVDASAVAGHRRGHAMSLWTRAEVAYRRGDKQRAVEPIEQALAEAREIGSIWLEREVLEALIERLHQLGRSDDAAQRQRELDALRSA